LWAKADVRGGEVEGEKGSVVLVGSVELAKEDDDDGGRDDGEPDWPVEEGGDGAG
jgi:hypothetical protein